MAWVGDLHKLPKTRKVPFYRDRKQVGEVQIPEELFKLMAVSDRVGVFYIGDSTKNAAFHIRVSGEYDVAVKFDWGLTGEISNLVFEGVGYYKCNIPQGFDIDALVELLKNGSLKNFVLSNGNLTKGQIKRIKAFGL